MTIAQRARLLPILGLCITSNFVALPIMAEEKYWACGSSWWDFNCWSLIPGVVPTTTPPVTGDDALLLGFDEFDRTIQYANFNSLTPQLNSLSVDARSTGRIEFLQAYHDFNTLNEYVGDLGTGLVTQTGGNHNVEEYLVLGRSSSANGTYNLSGSGMLNVNIGIVGQQGSGELNISEAGTVNSNMMMIGNSTGGTGRLNVEGADASLINNTTISVGNSGTGFLNIRNGANVTSNDTYLGYYPSTHGTVEVEGPGSVFENTANLNIGHGGTGTFTVRDGGYVRAETVYVSANGGTGNVMVSGPQSSFIANSNLVVGHTGQGFLSVENGGIVNSQDATLGNSGAASAFVQVSGDGSTWVNTDQLIVADNGEATLSVNEGATMSTSRLRVGRNAGSSGSVFVNGVGSHVQSSSLDIGEFGDGRLLIAGGAMVTSNNSHLASSETGAGRSEVRVEGAGSSLNIQGALYAGQDGISTLDVQSGAQLSTLTAHAGVNNISSSVINIDGQGTSWTNLDAINIGHRGDGQLNITNGAQVNSGSVNIATDETSQSQITMSGAGSQLNTVGGMHVAGTSTTAGGRGSLNINSGALANVGGDLTIWDNGTVNLSGGTLSANELAGTGYLDFRAGQINLAGNLNFDASSVFGDHLALSSRHNLNVDGVTNVDIANTLLLVGGTFSTGSLQDNGGFMFGSGTFNLTHDDLVIGNEGLFGSAVQFDSVQRVNVSHNTHIEQGAVLSLNNASFSSGNIINNGEIVLDGPITTLSGGTLTNHNAVSGHGRIAAQLNNTVNGEVRVMSADYLTFQGADNVNAGRITLLDGVAKFDQGLTNTGTITGRGALIAGNTATLDNQGDMAFSGRTDIQADVHNNGNGRIIVSGNSTTTFYDDVIHNGSEIRISEGSQAVFFGTVSGAGAYTGTGSVFFEGELLPGNSPALVNIEGDMNLGLLSHTTIELGGLIRGDEYDAFDVGQTLSLGGELEVVNLDLGSGVFSAGLGDMFDLFTADTIVGEFDVLTLASLGQGLAWQLNYLTDAIGSMDLVRLQVVSAVPVPPAVWLFASGLLGLVSVARRRTSMMA